jgi:anaerobic magnesium-protoporphyrin IX monomethyl ester cyclase
MRVLLLSMPDSFEHTPSLTMRMPNGGLASIAGNVDRHHRVSVADLVLVQRQVSAVVERLVHERDPDVVGLSVMTFQRRTALELIRVIRAIKPGVTVVAGGYDPSLAPEAYEAWTSWCAAKAI